MLEENKLLDDVSSLTPEQVEAQLIEAEKRVKELRERQAQIRQEERQSMLEKIKSVIEKGGVTQQELAAVMNWPKVATEKVTERRGKTTVPKFRNPDNPAETFSGKGGTERPWMERYRIPDGVERNITNQRYCKEAHNPAWCEQNPKKAEKLISMKGDKS